MKAYLFRREFEMDLSYSNVNDGLGSVEERSSLDDGWITLIFTHVDD